MAIVWPMTAAALRMVQAVLGGRLVHWKNLGLLQLPKLMVPRTPAACLCLGASGALPSPILCWPLPQTQPIGERMQIGETVDLADTVCGANHHIFQPTNLDCLQVFGF